MTKKHTSTTTINNTPRKVRLVASLVRGLNISDALKVLSVTQKKSSETIAKAIKSACSNAGFAQSEYTQHFVQTITVDEFTKLKRVMPRGRGSAAKFTRYWSKIKIEVS
jgi:large subunit ribosomal protein L22